MDLNLPNEMQSRLIDEVLEKSGIIIEFNLQKLLRWVGIRGAMNCSGMYANAQVTDWNEVITETILLNMYFSNPRTISVIFHELAHATGTYGRLDRGVEGMRDKDTTAQAVEEIIAELAAMRLMSHFGLTTSDTSEISEAYILMNHGRINSLVDAQKHCYDQADIAVKYILENWLVDFNQMYANNEQEEEEAAS
jgi:hypothetical protein